jgi:GcrA cell cycle regulator
LADWFTFSKNAGVQIMGRGISVWERIPELVGRLEEMVAKSFSFGKIAATLGNGLSRSAIAGKIYRSGMKYPQKPKNQSAVVQKVRERVRHKIDPFHRMSPYIEVADLDTPVSDTDIPLAQRKTLLQLEAYHCRYPIGEVGTPNFFFCGDTKIEGSSYCQHHTDRCSTQSVRKSVQLRGRWF